MILSVIENFKKDFETLGYTLVFTAEDNKLQALILDKDRTKLLSGFETDNAFELVTFLDRKLKKALA